ncbi:hypothetical protein [Bailinhaonella thermotolerans]|uniref:Antitoxin n=1 Tax=Bailinhaonella thermotolerans TaxID=1070861 RepID=A0A3A4A416_9ACTN|nr:hypothetical protein [Bailinhaonella thermotolerans]RJL23225.1 hypothetical protein D5H75_33170 [Bailinhaonella thermotolerans]
MSNVQPITITVDPAVAEYARQQVQAGQARSVSAWFNAAATRQMELDRQGDAAFAAAAARAAATPGVAERAARRAAKAKRLLGAG